MLFTVIAVQAVIFIVLIFVLRGFMQGHVSGAVGHLEKMNEDLLKQQAEMKQKIAEAEREYDSKMAKLQQEITARQTQVRQEANKTIEDAKARAGEEREKLIKEAIETKDKLRQEVMLGMEDHAIQYSEQVIAEFFSDEIKKKMHEGLIEEVLNGIRDVNMDYFQIESDTAELILPEPSTNELQQKIKKLFQEKIKKDIQIKDTIDPTLVGGMILKFGTFVIDGSLANRLKEATSRLRKENTRKYLGKT